MKNSEDKKVGEIYYIGLFGANGVGKSTIANMMKNRLEYPSMLQSCGIFSFADILRNVASELFSIPLPLFKSAEHKEKELEFIDDRLPFKTPRGALISLGEGLKSLYGSYFWADRLLHNVRMQSDFWVRDIGKDYFVIIDDLRFMEELEILEKQKHFLPVEIVRDDKVLMGGSSEVMEYFKKKGDGYVTIHNTGEPVMMRKPIVKFFHENYGLPSY